jgi:hypothetical protein
MFVCLLVMGITVVGVGPGSVLPGSPCKLVIEMGAVVYLSKGGQVNVLIPVVVKGI